MDIINLHGDDKQRDAWFFDRLKIYAHKDAIIQKSLKFTYQNLLQRIEELISILSKNNIGPQDVVAVVSEPSFESIALLLSLYANKNVIVPITSKVVQEIQERIIESYADFVIAVDNNITNINSIDDTHKVKHPLLQKLRQQKASGLILFSSGSTGKPKAMIHNFDTLVNTYKHKKQKDLIILFFLLFDHIGGLNTLFSSLAMGSAIVIPETRDADYVCFLIEHYQINLLPTSPTFLNSILMGESNKNHDLTSLRMITYGTETMPDRLLERVKDAFPKVKLLQTFGTSETGITQTRSKTSSSTRLKIDDPNIEYKTVDGELWLKSKTQILGYLNASMDRFTSDGWFRTGDLVEMFPDGYMHIVGRLHDVINVGGEKVLPSEVESIILELEQVADCLVYSEKNTIIGQIVVADVAVKEGHDSLNVRKLVIKHCRERLDKYKVPVKVNVVDKIGQSVRFKKIRKSSID